MTNAFATRFSFLLLLPLTFLTISLTTVAARAQNRLYNPIPIPASNEISDTLTQNDIPTGEGGFARDYTIDLSGGDQVAIDLISESFDTIVTLLASDGSTVAENDDGPDGTTNSLLFARITETGKYIIRVRAFGETGGGQFNLKVTRLRPI
ncbi:MULTISPECIES: PPC domain-containing protein [unclassified Coleofasciculus]|uniref:PPC domain-containing protein n=1 Tax=unclassified Coleofasciculus TaxID=2692782 RepID=UPI00187E3C87|nr:MULTISPECIES: PPC domain-containing protein [unclassified Coleofasciculus]MBE9124583.1 PPC domain-containing protein [Coleofasciculus sp. LEGE 07081]MBE9150372.1 PPC domain-containing protein [Coleofasciculus sp. LEGE 07092]